MNVVRRLITVLVDQRGLFHQSCHFGVTKAPICAPWAHTTGQRVTEQSEMFRVFVFSCSFMENIFFFVNK